MDLEVLFNLNKIFKWNFFYSTVKYVIRTTRVVKILYSRIKIRIKTFRLISISEITHILAFVVSDYLMPSIS